MLSVGNDNEQNATKYNVTWDNVTQCIDAKNSYTQFDDTEHNITLSIIMVSGGDDSEYATQYNDT